jgi:hypothetical protein
MLPAFKQKLKYHSQNSEALILGYNKSTQKINEIGALIKEELKN